MCAVQSHHIQWTVSKYHQFVCKYAYCDLVGVSNIVTGEHRSIWNMIKTYFATKNINPLTLICQNRAVCGYHCGFLNDSQLWTSALDTLLDLYKEGKIKPQIDTVWSFDDVSIT